MDNTFATRRTSLWVVLPVLLIMLLVVNAPPYVPLQDYNEWVYQGYVAAQMLHGHLTHQFAFAAYPVPNSATQALLCLLNLVVAPEAAARIVASLYVVAATVAGWQLSKKMAPAQNISCFFVLVVCVYFNSPFWRGYINYQFGIVLFSAWLLLEPAARRRFLCVLAFSLAGFFTHAVIWAAMLLLMTIDAVRHAKYRSYLPALISLGLFAWYAACRPTATLPNRVEQHGVLRALAYKLYTLAKLGPYHHFVYPGGNGTMLEIVGFYAGFVVNCAVAAGIICLFYVSLLRPLLAYGGWRRASDAQLAAFVLLILFAAMPAVMADVVNPGERMLYPALLLALLGLGNARVVRWLSCCAPVLAVGALSLVFNSARLVPDAAAIDARPGTSHEAIFEAIPASFADVQSILDGEEPPRALGFETSFLVNLSSQRARSQP